MLSGDEALEPGSHDSARRPRSNPSSPLRMSAILGLLFAAAACVANPAPAPIIYGPPALPGGPPADPDNPPQGAFQPNAYLKLCYPAGISNAPPHDDELWLTDFRPIVDVGGVVMSTVPANDVCLSSGYGIRSGRPHEGIDLTARPAETVFAAAPGIIRELKVSRGYGNMVLIDHGRGVYSRYAHLEFFDPALQKGMEIGFGVPIGRMGKSGNATGIHLHYEILTGDIDNPKGSKGLLPRDILNLPAWAGLDPGA